MSKLIKNSAWSLFAQAGKITTQASLFVLLARGFGVYEFGLYASIFSISQLVYNFSGLGTHSTMVMRVSRRPALLNIYIWTPILCTLVVGSILVSLLSFFIAINYNINFFSIVLITITELILYRIIDIIASAWQSLEDIKKGAILYLIMGCCRFTLAVILFFSGNMNIDVWVLFNFILTAIVAISSLYIMYCQKNLNFKKINWSQKEVIKGLSFSFSNSSQSINANVDKVILSKLGSLSDVGIYSVAYRVIQMALLPILAVFQATYPRYFKAGSNGLRDTLSFSKKISLPIIGYGLLTTLIIIFLSPIIPVLLGDQYKFSIKYIQYLAILPLIQSIQYLLGDAMSGAGFQSVRAIMQITSSTTLILLSLLLVPWCGVFGSIFSVLIAEVLLVIMYIFVIAYFLRVSK